MQPLKLLSETIYKETCNIIDAVEEILPRNLYASNEGVSRVLEEKLGYSRAHIRDVFSLATEMGLFKYLTRRRYSIILCKRFDEDSFRRLPLSKSVCSIRKFKEKCMIEFPALTKEYSFKNMQPTIDKTALHDQLEKRINNAAEKSFQKYLYKEITKDRTPISILDTQTKYIIFGDKNTWADLDRNYFIFKDNLFKITANAYPFPEARTDSENALNVLGQLFYYIPSIPVSAQTTLHYLHDYLIYGHQIPYGISLRIECYAKDGWRFANLISKLTAADDQIKSIELTEHPFIRFEDEKAFLDLTFFDD